MWYICGGRGRGVPFEYFCEEATALSTQIVGFHCDTAISIIIISAGAGAGADTRTTNGIQ